MRSGCCAGQRRLTANADRSDMRDSRRGQSAHDGHRAIPLQWQAATRAFVNASGAPITDDAPGLRPPGVSWPDLFVPLHRSIPMPHTRAYGTPAASQPLAPLAIERRAVGPHDVRIDILYCGVCHSDLHTARNEWGNTLYPSVPGHEIVGTVTTVGVGCMVDSCQHCASCADGEEQYCENGFTGTYNGRGKYNNEAAYSENIVV